MEIVKATSIDMIRMRVKMDRIKVVDFFDKLLPFCYWKNVKHNYYIGKRKKDFGYNYVFYMDQGSFWMGHSHNNEVQSSKNTYLYINITLIN